MYKRQVYESPSVMDIQAYCTQEKATLWDESKRLINPQEVYVDLSRKLYDLKNQLLDDAHTIKDLSLIHIFSENKSPLQIMPEGRSRSSQ